MRSITCGIIVSGLVGLCIWASGCSAVPVLSSQKPIEIRGLIIRNNTDQDVRDVQLLVEKTRTIVTCSYIPAGGTFSTEFPLRAYQGNHVQAAWSQYGRTFQTRPVYAQIPDDLDPAVPVHAEVLINPRASMVVLLAH